MSNMYSLQDEEELFQMANAAGFEVPTTAEFEEFINDLVRYDYDDVVNDISNWHNECQKKWKGPDTDKKKHRNEQRYAICAGLHQNDIPNDLARWVSAFAVPRSKIYSYMPVPNIEKKVNYKL